MQARRTHKAISAALLCALLSCGCTHTTGMRLAISDVSAQEEITNTGEEALAISLRLTNEGDQPASSDLWPELRLDGTPVLLEVEGSGGTEKPDVLEPGESLELVATVAPSAEGANEWKLVAAEGCELSGEEQIETIAEASEVFANAETFALIDGVWVECDKDDVRLEILSCLPQATTEVSPARLTIRGTISNDTSRAVPATKLPTLLMDGSPYEMRLYAKGKPVEALLGRGEEEPSIADFEIVCEFDPSVKHTFEFEAAPSTLVDGLDLASEIEDYLASFTL